MASELEDVRRRLRRATAERDRLPLYLRGGPQHTELVERVQRLARRVEELELERRYLARGAGRRTR
jgi:hypothetical protein